MIAFKTAIFPTLKSGRQQQQYYSLVLHIGDMKCRRQPTCLSAWKYIYTYICTHHGFMHIKDLYIAPHIYLCI